jgi:hypothetical protein
MFFDDITNYLDDFGSPCVKGNVKFSAILDMPDSNVSFSGIADALSTDYSLTYPTNIVSFKRGDAVTVAGVNYTARGVGEKMDDGVFSKVTLQK